MPRYFLELSMMKKGNTRIYNLQKEKKGGPLCKVSSMGGVFTFASWFPLRWCGIMGLESSDSRLQSGPFNAIFCGSFLVFWILDHFSLSKLCDINAPALRWDFCSTIFGRTEPQGLLSSSYPPLRCRTSPNKFWGLRCRKQSQNRSNQDPKVAVYEIWSTPLHSGPLVTPGLTPPNSTIQDQFWWIVTKSVSFYKSTS